MKTSPSKSTRSSRTTPYHGRLPGQAATGAGGIAYGDVVVKRGLIQDGVGVVRGHQQQEPVDLVVQLQEQMPPPRAPVAPQVQEGPRSCRVLQDEVDSLQYSVDQLSLKLEMQGRKITRMREGFRNYAVTLSEVVREGFGEGQRANGDEEDEQVDVGYDSEMNTGEGIDTDGGQGAVQD